MTVPNGDSRRPQFAAQARRLTFQSRASNLTEEGSNGRSQIFLSDLDSGDLQLVSTNSAGELSNGDCAFASLSADASKLIFQSDASNLVEGDDNSFEDIFLRDLETGETQRVSVGDQGEQGDSASLRPSLSHDGTQVCFASRARNLVDDDTSYQQDIFVRDLGKGKTQRINLSPQGQEANGHSDHPMISGNGRFVVFRSEADNLVANDNNRLADIFVHDRHSGTTERVNLNSQGQEANAKTYEATISDDGRYVAFYSHASNLVEGDRNGHLDVFVRDRLRQSTERVSLDYQGREIQGASLFARISGDGKSVAFVSSAPGITEKESYGFNDVLVRDRQKGVTRRASIGSRGARSKAGSTDPALSTDGEEISFASWASNLVDESTRDRADIYLKTKSTGETRRVSQSL